MLSDTYVLSFYVIISQSEAYNDISEPIGDQEIVSSFIALSYLLRYCLLSIDSLTTEIITI